MLEFVLVFAYVLVIDENIIIDSVVAVVEVLDGMVRDDAEKDYVMDGAVVNKLDICYYIHLDHNVDIQGLWTQVWNQSDHNLTAAIVHYYHCDDYDDYDNFSYENFHHLI